MEKLVFSGDMNGFALWKFAKAYSAASKKSKIFSLGGLLDTYVIYKSNQQSILHSDEERPDFLHIVPGDSSEFQRNVVQKRDEHAVIQYTQYGLIPVPVKRLRDFIPSYIEREKSKNYNMLLEYFECPVWVKNENINLDDENNTEDNFSEAIIFWLFKMRNVLYPFFNQFKNIPVEINLTFNEEFFKIQSPIEDKSIKPEELNFNPESDGKSIFIKIPGEIVYLLIKPNNEGEKALMRAVLTGLNLLIEKKGYEIRLNENVISNQIEEFLVPSNAKMILFFDTSNNFLMDPRWLLPLRKIQDSETSIILDNLVSDLNLTHPIPEIIQTKEEKNNLCNKIVDVLINKITGKLKIYNSGELLKWLMKLHERCIQVREYREIHIPAKIACFSDFPTEVAKLENDNAELSETTLSYRCLIEFIAAAPAFGSNRPNMDDIDELLALMEQVTNWGMLSDTIHFGLDDPKMGLLPSGRIGTDKSFLNTYMKPFNKANIENVIYTYESNFENSLNKRLTFEKAEPTEESQEIDAAFEDEWKISLTKILFIKGELVRIALNNENSVVEFEENKLMEILKARLNSEMTVGEIDTGIEFLTLDKRKKFDKAPSGFEAEDIYPWKYNRALSYLRKPLIKIRRKDETIWFYWSFRHVLSTAENLNTLLFDGRLKVREGGLLDKFVKKINTEKGKVFRNKVAEWLKKNSELKVIDFEVEIKENGHLVADKNYGDIDILAIDEKNKIIYSKECKNTVSARVIHEMKSEMDKYLGREGKDGLIKTHVERDKWLKANTNKLTKFVPNANSYTIKSLVITSQEIPLIYLAKEKIPLPIISFRRLKREGISAIEKL